MRRSCPRKSASPSALQLKFKSWDVDHGEITTLKERIMTRSMSLNMDGQLSHPRIGQPRTDDILGGFRMDLSLNNGHLKYGD